MRTGEIRDLNSALRRERVRAEIEAKFRPSSFEYLDLVTAEVLHVVLVGIDGFVAVIGNGDNGTYEWVTRYEGGGSYSHSDAGYGCDASALRDGLADWLDG